MEFRILGPLEVLAAGRVVPLPRRRQRALLAVLILHVGKVVSVDRLLEDLWGEYPPRTATGALHNYVSQLRKAIGADLIVTHASGYALDVAPERIDLGRFEQLAAEARALTDSSERANKLRLALDLWRGPPLPDLAFEPFAQLELPRLDELRLGARQDLIDAELDLGRHTGVLRELESLVDEHPFDERLRGQLMLALYRVGRQADALDEFKKTRRLLVEELGIEASPELRALEHAILRQDPALAVSQAAWPALRPARKTVTVLVAEHGDPSGELDPEALDRLFERRLDLIRVSVERHGGAAERLVGDTVIAVFGVPVAHEDDALRAVRAACDVRAALDVPELRIGLSTGEVYVADPAGRSALVTGAPVSAAKRLAQAASPGEVLLGAPTVRLVRGAVTVESSDPLRRGAEQPLPVFRLLTVIEGVSTIERRLEAALVGRKRELAELRRALDAVRGERRCRVVTVLGEAGIGKTRLVGELLAEAADDTTVLIGRCVSYGEGATYLPLAEMLSRIGDDLDAVLAAAASTGEELLAIRRYFESLARRRPLVLVFEDIHWAEPTLLDVIEHLRGQVSGVPLLVLCLARTELLVERPGWPDALQLLPLPDRQTLSLLEAAAGGVEPNVRSRIVEIAEGNPLYAEQLLAYVVDGGAIDAVPPSIEALLASRFEQLGPHVRGVIGRAALAGREFRRAALLELSPSDEIPFVDRHLAELARKGFLHPSSGDGLRFHHVLIRDVAYAGIPKAERVELHERLADWLDGQPEGTDQLVGYHLEQASRLSSELEPGNRRAKRLAADAGGCLGGAGIRAWKRGDTPAAINLLGRAAALLAEGDSFRLALLCELGVALRGAGELDRAADMLVETADTAATAGDRRAHLRARLELANVRMFTDPGGRADELLDVAAEAIPVFEAVDDDHSLSRAWRLIGFVQGAMRCRYAAAVDATERALDYARKSGWSTAASIGDLAAALYHGPTPVPEAISRCHELLEHTDLGGRAGVLVHLGGLEATLGHFDEARCFVDQANDLYHDLGQTALAHGNCGTLRGQIELLAGDSIAAEQAFRTSYAALASIGDRAYLATRAAELAEAVLLNGRHDESERWSRVAEQFGSSDDVPTQFLWRAVRSRLLAASGDLDEAQALAAEAAHIAGETDALNQRAKVMLDLAEVLSLAGRAEDAVHAIEGALRLFEQKGNLVGQERARVRLAELESPDGPRRTRRAL